MITSVRRALADAQDGRRVLVLAPTWEDARTMFDDACKAIESAAVVKRYSVSKTSGRERVSFDNGGQLEFRSIRSSNRGKVFDHVYLPADASHEVMCDVAPCVTSSADPAIIGCFDL